MKLVLVDDSEDLRQLLRKRLATLTRVEFTGEAGNVKDAIRLLESQSPDVAILDFQLPDGTALDILRSAARGSASPVFIVFTSHTGEQYRELCLRSGAAYFFNKTREMDALVATLLQLAGSME